jgi:caffeoyl-CoA O-methyltransferase
VAAACARPVRPTETTGHVIEGDRETELDGRRFKVAKKSALSVLLALTFLSAAGSLGAQQGGIGRPVQGRWIFSDSSPDKRPLSADPNEQRVLNVLDEIAQSDNSGLLVPLEDGRLLRMFTESTGAKNVVEIGTYNGYSGLWFCLALRTTGGRIVTHEINPKYAALARENFNKAGVGDLVTIVEGDAHETVTRLKEPIDILFIDADKPGYADYLKKLLPLVRPGGLILAHNTTNTARQMPDYFTAATTDPSLDSIFIGQQSVGLGITIKKRRAK